MWKLCELNKNFKDSSNILIYIKYDTKLCDTLCDIFSNLRKKFFSEIWRHTEKLKEILSPTLRLGRKNFISRQTFFRAGGKTDAATPVSHPRTRVHACVTRTRN